MHSTTLRVSSKSKHKGHSAGPILPMKLVLEFNIPDDQYNMWCAVHAAQLYNAISDIQQELRNNRKYGKEDSKTLDDITQRIVELYDEIGDPLA